MSFDKELSSWLGDLPAPEDKEMRDEDAVYLEETAEEQPWQEELGLWGMETPDVPDRRDEDGKEDDENDENDENSGVAWLHSLVAQSDEELPSAVPARKTPNRGLALRRVASRKQMIAGAAIGVGFALVIAAAVNLASSEEEQPAEPALTAGSNAAPATTADVSAVASEAVCAEMPPPSFTSMEGAVVAFNTAYYEGNAKQILESVSADSYLSDQDWPSIVGNLGDMTWCGEVEVTGATQANVDAVVTNADGASQNYEQRYTFYQNARGEYRVEKIEERTQ